MDLKINIEGFKENLMGLIINRKKTTTYDELSFNTKNAFSR